jgi:UDP-glucose 4-epimerase
MKVLVTGGAGYIGSHTAQHLIDAGHQVVVFDNLSTGFKEALPANAQFIIGDVRDAAHLTSVMQKEKIEAVLHFAAKLVVPESITEPLDYYENNVGGVISLVKACRAVGVDKIIFSSSAAIYGDSVQGLVTEEVAPAPLNPYAQSKLISEKILSDCEKAHGIRTVSLRYFNVAGAEPTGNNGQRAPNATHLIKVAAETACGKRSAIQIFGTDYPTPDGTCIRDYIHISDLADAHVLALQYLVSRQHGVALNCGYGRGFSVSEVIQMMKKVSSVDFIVEKVGRRAGDSVNLIADSRKLKQLLNWKPKYESLEFICRSAYDWEKTQSKLS